jgi:hypothetical protein
VTGLTSGDFEVTGGAAIGTVSVSGDTATVPVTFATNTTPWAKTYTVSIAASSTLIGGSDTVAITQAVTAAGPGNSKETATTLTSGVWTTGTVISTAIHYWYKFEANSANTYTLTWDEKFTGSATYTGGIWVTAYESDGTTPFGNIWGKNDGYGSDAEIISGYTGTVYIEVEAFSSPSDLGTFAVKYTQN